MMTETTPNVKDFVNASKNKPPRNRAKSTIHDVVGNISKVEKKSQIKDVTNAIAAKAIADADAFADELYSEAFLNRLSVKREAIEALSFIQLQGKAKQKTAHVLSGGDQLQLAGSADIIEPTIKIFACEDWLGDEDE